MGFFDLNIPFHESDRNAVDKTSLKRRRLTLALRAMELGYTGVAYNRTLKGVISESDRCSTPLFPLSKHIPSSSAFFAAVKFHRQLMNVPTSSPFRQYTRLTAIIDIASQASALNSGNPILKSYDIVAVRPMNQNAFDQACQTSEVNVISIDFSDKLPFRLKQPMVKAAIKRGVYFEIIYSGLLADAQTRRQIISNCKLLVDWAQGKNLIISSGAPSVSELRGPQDVANLFSLLGLNRERAKAAISKNCSSLLENALRKKQFYKEAVKVEQAPSGGQHQSAFNDWLKWDPLSSGEGDMLLDEMEKFFAISSTHMEPVEAIKFTSSMNGLPAHGLQIKDLLSGTKLTLDSEPTTLESENLAAVGKLQEPSGINPLHEEQVSLPQNQATVTYLTEEEVGAEGQNLSSDAMNMILPADSINLKTSKDYVPELVSGLQPLREEGQTSSGYEALGTEGLTMPTPPTHNDTWSNPENFVSISSENVNYSNDLKANLGASEIHMPPGLNLHDSGADSMIAETRVSNGRNSGELSNPLEESRFSDFTLRESNAENRCDVGVCKGEGVPTGIVPTEIDSEKEQELPSDAPAQDVSMEGEQISEKNFSAFELSDDLPVEGLVNLETNASDPIPNLVGEERMQSDSVSSYQGLIECQAGRGRRKRKSPHQPLLFPFKHLLNPRLSKRKFRKGKPETF